MYQTILVPLDGSPFGERPLAYLPALAAGGPRVVLLHVVSHRLRIDEGTTGYGMGSEYLTPEQRERLQRYLQAAAGRIRWSAEGARPSVDLRVRAGVPGPIILEEAATSSADLIVMSTHSRAAVGRWLFGSVADEVTRHATAPVLLVPPTRERTWDTAHPKAVLVPLDGKPLSERALGPASMLAGALGAELLLVRAVPPPDDMGVPPPPAPLLHWTVAVPDFDPEPQLAHAERWLEDVASMYRTSSQRVTVRAEYGMPAAVIAAVAQQKDADAIVIATHARNGVARLVHGSVEAAVVARATLPVVVVRATTDRSVNSSPSGLREVTRDHVPV